MTDSPMILTARGQIEPISPVGLKFTDTELTKHLKGPTAQAELPSGRFVVYCPEASDRPEAIRNSFVATMTNQPICGPVIISEAKYLF